MTVTSKVTVTFSLSTLPVEWLACKLARHVSTVDVEASTVSVEASTVSVEASTVSVEVSTVSVEASTVSVEASTVSVEASTVSVEASTVSVEASTVNVEASTVELYGRKIKVFARFFEFLAGMALVEPGCRRPRAARQGSASLETSFPGAQDPHLMTQRHCGRLYSCHGPFSAWQTGVFPGNFHGRATLLECRACVGSSSKAAKDLFCRSICVWANISIDKVKLRTAGSFLSLQPCIALLGEGLPAPPGKAMLFFVQTIDDNGKW